jgi:hypothetical protein
MTARTKRVVWTVPGAALDRRESAGVLLACNAGSGHFVGHPIPQSKTSPRFPVSSVVS